MHRQPRIRVGGLIVAEDGRIVLIRQGDDSNPRWMLPGGGVEGGESMSTALQRELREEIGLDRCRVGEPIAMVESIAPVDCDPKRHIVHVIFAVTVQRDVSELQCQHDPDVREIRLVAPHELTALPLRPPIADFLGTWHPELPFAWLGPLWAQ